MSGDEGVEVRLEQDEWYPWAFIVADDRSYGDVVKVDAKTVARWKRFEKRVALIQGEMQDAIKSARSSK